jgi:hypothetical protein
MSAGRARRRSDADDDGEDVEQSDEEEPRSSGGGGAGGGAVQERTHHIGPPGHADAFQLVTLEARSHAFRRRMRTQLPRAR